MAKSLFYKQQLKALASIFIRDLRQQLIEIVGTSCVPYPDGHDKREHVAKLKYRNFLKDTRRELVELRRVSVNKKGKPISK